MGWLAKLYDTTFGRAGKKKNAEDAPPPEDEEEDEEEDPNASAPEDEEEEKKEEEEKAKGGKKKAEAAGAGQETQAAATAPATTHAAKKTGKTARGSREEFLRMSARFGEDFATRAFADGLTYTAASERYITLQAAHIASLEARLKSLGRMGEENPPNANLPPGAKTATAAYSNAQAEYAAYLEGPPPAA